MSKYEMMTKTELKSEFEKTYKEFEALKGKNLKLDMSRGKPGSDQLDLSEGLLTVLSKNDECYSGKNDVRNYGMLDGIPECKKLFAEVLGVSEKEVFVGGSASLTLMYDVISKAYTHGLATSVKPWCRLDKVKFLCPAPGYDRHFRIAESFGAELITIPMTDEGPDMDMVENEVRDPAVKGIWCVPKYSNPEGVIYSDRVISRMASLKPAAPDFTIMWDNAYCVHEFDGDFVPFKEILTECRNAGNPDMVYEFASTSKITFPGAGVAVIASSERNLAYMKKLLGVQMISYDKVNQLRHARFLKDREGVLNHMKKHAAIMKPKFKVVLSYLDREIKDLDIASWKKPEGGYFVSLDTQDGCAKRTLALAQEAGVTMTEAGATYPYGIDPRDRNIRIAPSYPPVDELKLAMEIFCVCLKLAAMEKALGK
ncbi:MAG: aminotransferase class I/II-fold pyridoxal phosphate-dependent enzyme [Bacillota bacterium]|nr:aminotransferase class I/II-fold pyridoxal phosphate-dependent enzyme [Bacillota bacterium]